MKHKHTRCFNLLAPPEAVFTSKKKNQTNKQTPKTPTSVFAVLDPCVSQLLFDSVLSENVELRMQS